MNSFFRPRFVHPNHFGLYGYHAGDVFFPGAQNQVFEPAFNLPIIAVQGHGIPAGNSPRAVQPPQVYAGNPVTVSGLGGLSAGQWMFAPLSITDDNG